MQNWAILIGVAIMLITDAIVVTVLLRSVVGGVFNKLHELHPPVGAASNAVRKDLQSFRSGLINLGWSINVTVDEDHLHLEPAKIFRWFGAKSSSIPWRAVEPRKTFSKRVRNVRIGAIDLTGPKWCLELAGDPA
ncbi:MAG: hypothetical protein AAGB51_05395 [Planctomycetota bacterium]